MTTLALLSALLLWPPRRPPASGRWTERGRDGEVRHGPVTVGDAADALVLLVAALQAGAGLVDTLEAVARVPGVVAGPQLAAVAQGIRSGLGPTQSWSRLDPAWSPAAVAWSAADRAGVAPGRLLDAAADRLRSDEAARLDGEVARASVLLVLPLGLCFLPAFVLTSVVPVVARLAQGLLDG